MLSSVFLRCFTVVVMGFYHYSWAASDIQTCSPDAKSSNRIMKVDGVGISAHEGPSRRFNKVINEKASRIFNTTHYVTIDDSVTVKEECTAVGWSKFRVTEPAGLAKSHRGWVESKFLRPLQTVTVSGSEYSDWHTEFNLDITKTLVSNKINGCGQYKYRASLSSDDDFLVSCTKDGVNWVQYFISNRKVK